MSGPYHALIRTHHITSRKKVSALKSAAKALNVSCLLRSGGSPGVMYVEGEEPAVRDWVATVQRLKYKDYQLASRPARVDDAIDMRDSGAVDREKGDSKGFGAGGNTAEFTVEPGCLEEVESVKDFGAEMQKRGVWAWWRKGMGFAN